MTQRKAWTTRPRQPRRPRPRRHSRRDGEWEDVPMFEVEAFIRPQRTRPVHDWEDVPLFSDEALGIPGAAPPDIAEAELPD